MSTSVAFSNSRNSSNDTQFLITIHGVSYGNIYDRFEHSIDTSASHGIWTDMAFFPDGSPGSKGSVRMQRKDEAMRLFDYLNLNLVEGRRLKVHLFDTSASPPDFLKGNCKEVTNTPCQNCARKHAESSSPGSSTSSGSTYSLTAANQYPQPSAAPVAVAAAQNSTASLASALANLQLAQQDPRFQDPRYLAHYQLQYQQALRAQQLQAAASHQASAGYAPAYTMSSSGTPVNTRHGTVRTEARGVFINGLNYKARTKDVEEHFRKAGKIVKCDVHKDHATGKSKGVATIQFASNAEARKAIERFDGESWMGMKLKVRHDREATAVSPPPGAQASKAAEPIIVNGSQVANVVGKERKDSVVN